MRLLLLPLLLLSSLGLLCSMTLHFASLTGHVAQLQSLLTEDMQFQVMTSITNGIFVVWLPAVLISHRINKGNRLKFSWKQVLAGCPQWMSYAAYGLFAYAFINFFLSISTREMDSQQGLRTFSGHWMMFYGMAFCIFFSSWRLPSLLRTRQCLAGHDMAQADQFCSLCGLPAAQSGQDEP
ncbi:hypothetical protein KUF54_03795 [Comamonas sp. Y33R10-2]|nr:hypothetical protein KUF54_03795 [Comamonas sp. Y33R10-2]